MKRPNRTQTKAFFILSIIVPVGLLATFRLTGILQEPLSPLTVTAQEVVWNIRHPAAEMDIAEEVINFYSDNITLVSLNVFVVEYEQSYLFYGIPESHGLRLMLSGAVNVSGGFIHSIILRFSQLDSNSTLDIMEDSDAVETYNTKLERICDWLSDSYVEGYGVNQPKYCKLSINARWSFLDIEKNVEHYMRTDLEVTYFDGTTYRRVIVPIRLGVFVS